MKQLSHQQRFAVRAIAVAAALCSFGAAQAGELETGNPDLTIRFDNTVKYNFGYRVNQQDPHILKSANFDDGDRNFDKGVVSNRFDILSEFDLVYDKRFGLRVSAAGWDDFAYRNLDNTNLASSNHRDGTTPAYGLSHNTVRYHKGVSGEILDAFVFGKFDLGDMPVNVKLGQHTLYWGESLLSPIHGNNYGQSAIDLIKGYAVPGSEAKELFLPRQAISTQFSPSNELSFAAQYFFKWKPARLPESGSFLGFYDYGFQGAETFNLGPLGSAWKRADSNPDKRGDFGVAARWSPQWLDGTAGLYLRRTSDLLPQANVRLVGLPMAMLGVCAGAIPGAMTIGSNCIFRPGVLGRNEYQLEYASDIDMLGLSLSKSVAGISLGVDLNFRRNMPLNSSAALLMPVGTVAPIIAGLSNAFKPALVVTAANLPEAGEVSGARGNTVHGVLNLLGTTAATPLFDASSWIAELTWSHVAKVTSGAQFYKGRDSYTGIDKVTKDFVGLALNFTPTWFQALPGVDVSMPLSYAVGLSGTSAVNSGGNKNAGNYAVGVSFDVRQKYRIDFKYVDFFGPYATDASGAITSNAGVTPLLKDRGFLALTLKTTF
ncbi:MAG: DUF1302 domain-containing protein [Pseudomonadota bacterium]